ncbi:MAG: hypothetical protein U0T84_08940 [Chitinophagales bacterium]
MYIKHQLNKLLVSLDIDGQNALFIAISKQGDIARKGNGAAPNQLPLLQGVSHQGHFDAFMMTISEDVFAYSGVFDQKPYTGRICTLMIVFNGEDEAEAGFKCIYGDQSDGPPGELVQMVINAVKLTQPWYDQQISAAKVTPIPAVEKEKKPWWQMW